MTSSVLSAPSRLSLFLYALIGFPLAFAGLPVYVHTPDFYATHVGLGIGTVGGILLLMRFIDAIQDPIIGSLSDRYHAHRAAVTGLGAVLMVTGFFMLYHPVSIMPASWWLAVSVFVCTTGYSIVVINIQAAGGLWHVPENQRTRVTAWREIAGLLGLLCASAAPALFSVYFGNTHGFAALSGVVLVFTVIGMIGFMLWLKRSALSGPPQDKAHTPLRLADLLAGHSTRRFFLVYALSMLASSIPAVLVIFFIRDHLAAENMTGLFLFIYFISGAAGMPLWAHLAARFGKKPAWGQAMILAVATFVWALFLEPGDVTAYALVCALSGLAFGADLALPPAIMADKIAIAGHQNGASRYYAFLAFLSKGALALATGGALILLDMAGYVPGQKDPGPILVVVYALLPCIIKSIAAFILFTQKKGVNYEVLYHVSHRGGGDRTHA